MIKRIKRGVYAIGFLWKNRSMVWNVMNRTDELKGLRYEAMECPDCGEVSDDLCEVHEEELKRIGGIN